MLCSIHDELKGDLDLVGDVFAANFVLTEAKCATLASGGRALTPAYRANTICIMLTGRVAKSSTLHLVLVASQLSASCAAV